MIDPKDLQAIFQRFASRSHTDADLEIIRQEYETGSFIVAAGDRSVAGPVIGSVVVTGDGNTI